MWIRTVDCALIQGCGSGEILIVLAVILLLFGANRLPALARSLGRSLGEFKKGKQEGEKNPDEREPSADSKTEDKSE